MIASDKFIAEIGSGEPRSTADSSSKAQLFRRGNPPTSERLYCSIGREVDVLARPCPGPPCFSRPICQFAMMLNDAAKEADRQHLLPYVTRLACADTHATKAAPIPGQNRRTSKSSIISAAGVRKRRESSFNRAPETRDGQLFPAAV